MDKIGFWADVVTHGYNYYKTANQYFKKDANYASIQGIVEKLARREGLSTDEFLIDIAQRKLGQSLKTLHTSLA